jgi:RNA polymerase sigma-70 factor (ECF subfamily)
MTDVAIAEAVPLETTVQRAADGDASAFARLVSTHHASMARVAYVICGDPDLTQDVLQAAWTIAWRRLRELRQPEQVRAWLVAVAANEARQQVRRRRTIRIVDVSGAADPTGGPDPADTIGAVDLQRALRSLGAEDRMLLALRYVAGLDSTEIAAQLGGSASGIRSRLARLLQRLRADLAFDDPRDKDGHDR